MHVAGQGQARPDHGRAAPVAGEVPLISPRGRRPGSGASTRFDRQMDGRLLDAAHVYRASKALNTRKSKRLRVASCIMARIDAFLKLGVAQGCSDLHLAVGVPPMLRMHGDLMPIKFRDLGEAELEGYITEVLTQSQLKMLREGQRPRLLLRVHRGRALSSQRIPQGNRHRRRVSGDSHADAEHRSAGAAADRAQALRLSSGHDPGHRLHRHRQDDDAGLDDRLPEHHPHAQHHQPGGSDRVRSPQQVEPGHPTRIGHAPADRSPRACAPPCARTPT